MKHIANIISIIRIIVSIIMICFYRNKLLFISLYLICGLSDIMDGYIARKTNTQSSIGAKLDSFADLIMFGVITTFILIKSLDKIAVFLPWVIATAIIRCINMIIAAYKYRSFISLHTLGNKLAGFLVFISPLLFVTFHTVKIFWPVCIISVLSAIEEGAIHLTTDKLDLNRKSIFHHE
ncbi:CDP-alcohol phosphatidyltransferase family protein [Clostridium pasteurianum]|uniref:Phosphatidylglycerophosphate synthase n=1 Tax=Clostridium pasteurianum BC1 TaxID=86416 RepID=R4K8L4_CLOPA|nr:CDP-alcohol phosphatidyltransferase family protein [Clostridium pasteurianum]AGK95985.1 phosphatidylserine synthase [Clostridium pasteurianum BC1]